MADIFLHEKNSNDQNTENLLQILKILGCVKIKGARNGSDTQKMKLWGCAKIRGAKI